MKKSGFLIITAVFLITGCAAVAADEKKSGSDMMGGQMMMSMKTMDGNGDGLVSKDEFMKSHEAMFDAMKTKDGMIDMKNMPMHCNMMGAMMEQGNMMHQHMGKPNR